ncbi:MAG: hypothetical protein V3V62_01000 [bacterium]
MSLIGGLAASLLGPAGALAGGAALALGGGLLAWALIERFRRRRAARARDEWRGRALEAERWAETAGRIAEERAEVDARTAEAVERVDEEADEARRRIHEADDAAKLVEETQRFFGGSTGAPPGAEPKEPS